jgi:hypothetical protein
MARCFWFVLLCSATIAPVGDHFHVARGVTEYLTEFGPIWLGHSPLWFVLLVAPFMATLAVAQGRAASRRGPGSAARVFAAPLWIAVLYLTTSFWPWRDGGSLEALMTLAAIATWWGLDRTGRGLVVALGVAIVATATEWGLVQAGVFRYLPQSDELGGVAPWLLPLYASASAAVGSVGRRMLVPGGPAD